MLRLERLWLVPFAALTVAAGTTAPAHADEAYVCDDGRVVYVKLAELEEKKRTDQCVAAYWGLTVESPKSRTDTATAAPAPAPEIAAGKAPAQKMPAVNGSAPLLKPTAEPEIEAPRRRNVEEKSAAIMPAKAAPNTDFRNVKIINGGNSGAWYRHTR